MESFVKREGSGWGKLDDLKLKCDESNFFMIT